MADQMTEGGRAARKPRADAARNRERVLEAAHAVFGAGGPEASLEAVARQAGVGIGTLYRHFPTREVLFEAVYRREVQNLADLAETLGAGQSPSPSPIEALRFWMHANVAFIATKKGMSAALAQAALAPPELMAHSVERLTRAMAGLMSRAVDAGEIRSDIDPQDLLRGLVGLCYVHDKPDWRERVLPLVDVLVDGLRRRDG
jgi:AcrR family transcriptional regulator